MRNLRHRGCTAGKWQPRCNCRQCGSKVPALNHSLCSLSVQLLTSQRSCVPVPASGNIQPGPALWHTVLCPVTDPGTEARGGATAGPLAPLGQCTADTLASWAGARFQPHLLPRPLTFAVSTMCNCLRQHQEHPWKETPFSFGGEGLEEGLKGEEEGKRQLSNPQLFLRSLLWSFSTGRSQDHTGRSGFINKTSGLLCNSPRHSTCTLTSQVVLGKAPGPASCPRLAFSPVERPQPGPSSTASRLHAQTTSSLPWESGVGRDPKAGSPPRRCGLCDR